MLGTLGLFGGLFAGWWLLLWWGLPISFQKMSPTAMLLTHLAPPVILGVVWRIWQRIRESRIVQAQAAGQEAAEADRQAQREAARQQHYAVLAERQIKSLCRGVWVQALPVKDGPAWLEEIPDGVYWTTLERDEISTDIEAGKHVQLTLQQLLSDVYAAVPGAAWLPHYFEANPELEGREQLEMLKQAQLQVIASQNFEEDSPRPEPRFFPGSGMLMSRVQQLFQQDTSLPGVLVYAADAPLLRRSVPEDEWDEQSPEQREINKWQGTPGYAATAMIFLRDNLPVPEPLSSQEDAQDAYTPYWEKQQHYGDERWGNVPLQWQNSLLQLPVLAELRLGEQASIGEKQLLPMTRQIHTLFDNALVNAGLRDYPFSSDDKDEAKDQAESILWLVHNSGDVDVGGTRLAAVSSALQQYAVPLNPIDDASNFVREWGDVGSARSVFQTAMAIVHSARLTAPTVLTEFDRQGETEHFSVALIKPQEQVV
ncbi:hypothetical protein [Iodobacter ciconiae]|uniref:DUF2875 domain-containing protein n=1 Tax=Iodobacter ciconiae TaxID=2496266 RepID=A0A3S8ZPF3_9NEIS|nr:hypothetical protein [Iodobacter ciconiae]AZN35351.1 hypothetical protein EJO50_01900 [Iodobacter ciconiae]